MNIEHTRLFNHLTKSNNMKEKTLPDRLGKNNETLTSKIPIPFKMHL